jgi:hypothetical protein
MNQAERSIDIVRRIAAAKSMGAAPALSSPPLRETLEQMRARSASLNELRRLDLLHRFEEGRAAHLRRCGLREREIAALASATFDPGWKAARAVEDLLADPERDLLLLAGVPGTGKTVGGSSLLLAAREEVRMGELGAVPTWLASARYVRASDLANMDFFTGMEARKRMYTLSRVPLLVLDELGSEGAVSGPWRSALDELIDLRLRHLHRFKTVLCTNLSISRPKGTPPTTDDEKCVPFIMQYGPRVWRRVKDYGRRLSLGCVPCATNRPCEKHAIRQDGATESTQDE